MNLGIVQLQRGRSLSDPVERKRELKQAEETFLAIRGVAGQNDQDRLYLGQVYYWLGKETEGKKLFDEMLAARKRDPKVLLAVGQTLRTLGAISEAKQLVEEAYRQSSDDTIKFAAATIRAILGKDLDERLLWLKRTNPNDIRSQAALSRAKGQLAARDGRDSDAETHFRKAISLFGKLPESSSRLNNSAIAWLALFGVTNNSSDFDAAANRMEKAISLSPTNAILISNSGSVLVSGALQSLVKGTVDLKVVPVSASVELLAFLYRNAKERDEWARRVRSQVRFQKGVKYLNDAVLLSPKGSRGYAALLSLESFLRNTAALRELKRKILAAKVDTAETVSQSLEFFQGKDKKKQLDEFTQGVAKVRESIAKTKSKQDVNFAIARATLANSLVGLWMSGGTVDVNAVVTLAESAHRAAASSSRRQIVISSYAFRALLSVGEKDAAIRKVTEKYRRILIPRAVVAALLAHDATARKILLAHRDTMKLLALMREHRRDFPDQAGGEDWAILGHADPGQVSAIKESARKNDSSRLTNEISALLNPVSPSTSLTRYWWRTIEGNDAEAQKILDALKKHSIELPVAPKS